MQNSVQVLSVDELFYLGSRQLISGSSYYYPHVHACKGASYSPYCNEAEGYWKKREAAFIKFPARVIEGFDNDALVRQPLLGKEGIEREVEYKKFGEKTIGQYLSDGREWRL